MTGREEFLNKLAGIATKADSLGYTTLAEIIDEKINKVAGSKSFEQGQKETFEFVWRLLEEAGDNLTKLRMVKESVKHFAESITVVEPKAKTPEEQHAELSNVEKLLAFDL